MDTPRERLLATLIGGAGTVVSLILYQAIPDLVRYDHLVLRMPNAAYFLLVVAAIGAVGGRVGHSLFIKAPLGSLEVKAVIVGTVIGGAVALAGWSVTYIFKTALFPLNPIEEADGLMRTWLINAAVAGPVIAVVISLFVASGWRRRLESEAHVLAE